MIGCTVATLLLGAALFFVHRDLHSQNGCEMTFMWRPIYIIPQQFSGEKGGNANGKYTLHRYFEGHPTQQSLAISENDIPVLFVPGSGGSAKQVRSVASIMMNKTEMRKAPFRMHFYAVDFQEEISVLSGSLLERQREYVVRSIKHLQTLYNSKSTSKIVLIGHSFGGVVVHSLPAHPRFDVSIMGLVITLAAPLSSSPIVFDRSMTSFYETTRQVWKLREEVLRDVGVVSYSGGIKDFQVPDHLAVIEGVVHRPSWSIDGVDSDADHLCVLWCNQLTRHSTRILYSYGEEYYSKDKSGTPAKTIVKKFFVKDPVDDRKEETTILGTFDYPWVSRSYQHSIPETGSNNYQLPLISSDIVYTVQLESDCKPAEVTLSVKYENGLTRNAFKRNDSSSQELRIQAAKGSTIKFEVASVRVKGPNGCKIDVTFKPDILTSWYSIILNNVHPLVHYCIVTLLLCSILDDIVPDLLPSVFQSNILLLLLLTKGFAVFYYKRFIAEFVLGVTVFLVISTTSLLAQKVLLPARAFAKRRIHLSVFCWMTRVFFVLLPIFFLLNPCLAAALIFLRLMASSRSFSLLLSMICFGISIALTLAATTKDRIQHVIMVFLHHPSDPKRLLDTVIKDSPMFTNIFSISVSLFIVASYLLRQRSWASHLSFLRSLFLLASIVLSAVLIFRPSQSLEETIFASSIVLILMYSLRRW